MTNGYSKLPRKKTLFKNNKGLGLEVHDIVLENFIQSRIFNKKNTMFKTKIKDALVDKKAIADFQSEDPFVGIYFEDLIEAFSEQIKEFLEKDIKSVNEYIEKHPKNLYMIKYLCGRISVCDDILGTDSRSKINMGFATLDEK